MDAGNHFKNGESSKSLMSRRHFLVAACFALLAVFFVGCSKDDDGGDDGGGTGNVGSNTQITGKIENASQFSDVKKVKLLADSDDENDVVVEADFKSDGAFTVNLPKPVAAKHLVRVGEYMGDMTGVTVSNNNAKVLWIFEVWGFDASNERVAYFWFGKENSNTNTALCWFYTDSNVTISGTYTDIDEEYDEDYSATFALDLKTGWNVVYYTSTRTTQGGRHLIREEVNHKAVSGLKWIAESWK